MEHRTKERVWIMMDEMKGTKVGKVHSDLDCSEDNVHLACLIDMSKDLETSFG